MAKVYKHLPGIPLGCTNCQQLLCNDLMSLGVQGLLPQGNISL